MHFNNAEFIVRLFEKLANGETYLVLCYVSINKLRQSCVLSLLTKNVSPGRIISGLPAKESCLSGVNQ